MNYEKDCQIGDLEEKLRESRDSEERLKEEIEQNLRIF